MHTRRSGVQNGGIHPHDFTDVDGFVKLDAAHINRHTITARPIARTGVAGLVDPGHHGAAVYFATKVDVGGLGEELEGEGVGFHEKKFGIHLTFSFKVFTFAQDILAIDDFALRELLSC